MRQSFINDKEKLNQWQSSICMIPVLLGLIKEKFSELDQTDSNYLLAEINAYQTIYHSWQKTSHLNTRQQEWVKEIGGYLIAIEQTLFRSQQGHTSSISSIPAQPNRLEF